MKRAALAALAGLATLAGSPRARADVSLVPAADGQLGAWLVAGPLSVESAREKAPTVIPGTSDAALRFRVVSARDGALDLAHALGAGQKAGARALLGGVLALEEDLDGALLVSVDGTAKLFVDGRLAWQKAARALRGAGWDAVPLRLSRGEHRLVLELEHPGTWWALELRLLDARDLLAPRGARLRLPGTSATEAKHLARALLDARLDAGATARGFRPRLSLTYARGAPVVPEVPLRVTVRVGGTSQTLSLGMQPRGPRGVVPFEALLPALPPSTAGELEVEVELPGHTQKLSTSLAPEVPSLLARADAARVRLRNGLLDRETVLATLDEASAALARGAPGARARISALLDELEAGHDPLARPGWVSFARRSTVDGEPDPTLLHVPAGFAPGNGQRYPLVVLLHGLNGTPERVMEAFLDTRSRGPSVPGFVLAPYAHGNTFYRGPGEREVMAAVDWALSTFPIDPARVTVTGVSMGGTGASHLGLYHADRFAAAAPLCGYHSYFVRRDTKDRPLRPWEIDRMHHWSPASMAERGRNLPLWVAHGTRDFPLENSRVLVDRYRELGYAVTDEWPDTGHDVWTKAYAGARLFPWLARARLDSAPPRITVKSDSLRFGRIHWAAIRELETPGRAGLLDVDASREEIVVTTRGVTAFELVRGPRLPSRGAVRVVVDGITLVFDDAEPVAGARRDGRWTKGLAPQRGKRPGLEGPVRDVFLTPLVFTFGTHDPRTARANREVALGLARRQGPEVAYRVLPDTDLDAATLASHSVVAVGTARDHALLARVGQQLPIVLEGDAIRLGATRFQGPGTGATFIAPNPEARDRYLVVVTGLDAAGIWRALSLPQLLPDFLVYDAGMGPAAAEVVLGRDARVLAGGFFDADWQLPPSVTDPEASR